MSSINKSTSKPGNPSASAGSYDEDSLTWLQYPTDDAFERSYCSGAFQGGWSLMPDFEGAFKAYLDVGQEQKGFQPTTCETGSLACASHLRKHMETNMISRSSANVTAEEALAQGAARAAGISSAVGKDVYKVKTLMQPTHVDLSSSTSYFAIDAACKGFKNQPIKPALPVSSVPAPPLQNARSMKPKVFMSSPLSRTKRTLSESATSSSKRARTEYDTRSHTHHTESSRITEEGIIERDKMMAGAEQRCTKTSTSYSEASQSSMSLSGRETLYNGKHNQDDLELLTEL